MQCKSPPLTTKQEHSTPLLCWPNLTNIYGFDLDAADVLDNEEGLEEEVLDKVT